MSGSAGATVRLVRIKTRLLLLQACYCLYCCLFERALLLHLRIILIKVLLTDTIVQFVKPSVVDSLIYKRPETSGRQHLITSQRQIIFKEGAISFHCESCMCTKTNRFLVGPPRLQV